MAPLAALGLLAACHPRGAEQPLTGQELFSSCTACHGATGQGMQNLGAPNIAGLPKWYVTGQLNKFRAGYRGKHPDDLEGMRMRPMARQLKNDLEVDRVAAYVESLPKVKPAATLQGDAEAGKNAYAVCLACHGPQGAGNPQLNAPPISHLDDWYLLGQLKKFKLGLRGVVKEDVTGQQMRPMALTLADEQAMKNVLAYVRTLSQ